MYINMDFFNRKQLNTSYKYNAVESVAGYDCPCAQVGNMILSPARKNYLYKQQ